MGPTKEPLFDCFVGPLCHRCRGWPKSGSSIHIVVWQHSGAPRAIEQALVEVEGDALNPSLGLADPHGRAVDFVPHTPQVHSEDPLLAFTRDRGLN
jgi:hypothetical protein